MDLWDFCGSGLMAGGSEIFILVDFVKRVGCFYIFFLHSTKVVYLLWATLKSHIFAPGFRIVRPAKSWRQDQAGQS